MTNLRNLAEKLELIILQNIDTLVVGSQVVDLLPKDGGPELLADKLHQV